MTTNNRVNNLIDDYMARALLMPIDDFVTKLNEYDYFNQRAKRKDIIVRNLSHIFRCPVHVVKVRIKDVMVLKGKTE